MGQILGGGASDSRALGLIRMYREQHGQLGLFCLDFLAPILLDFFWLFLKLIFVCLVWHEESKIIKKKY